MSSDIGLSLQRCDLFVKLKVYRPNVAHQIILCGLRDLSRCIIVSSLIPQFTPKAQYTPGLQDYPVTPIAVQEKSLWVIKIVILTNWTACIIKNAHVCISFFHNSFRFIRKSLVFNGKTVIHSKIQPLYIRVNQINHVFTSVTSWFYPLQLSQLLLVLTWLYNYELS